MGKLDLAMGYLSGAMEFVADHGVGWRREFIDKVYAAGLNIDLIDPTNKPGGEEMRIGENKEHQEMLKREGRFWELAQYVGDYRRFDLRYVDLSDFLVVAIDPNRVPQWGTANETYSGETQHKPTFFLCEGGPKMFPNWLFDLLEFDNHPNPWQRQPINIFGSVDELISRLVALNNGDVPLSKEWVLIRKHIEDERERRLRRTIRGH